MSTIPDNREEQDLFEHHRFVVDQGQIPLRIDKFLMHKIQNASRNKIQNAAKAGNILVDTIAVKPNYKVKPGDTISIVLSFPPRETEIIPQNIPLDIVYEDEHLIFVNKPAGMVVHPAYGNYTGTLVNALLYYLQEKSGDKEAFPYLVHRIDKDTTGIMVVARDELTQSKLGKIFFDHAIDRKYIALVWGDLKEEEGTITGNITRSSKDRKIFTVSEDPEVGKHAVTHYKVLQRFRYVTLVQCMLETGRTHQIRVHFRYIGHPLFNDQTYGGDSILKGTTFTKYKQFIENCFKLIPRQALHAKSLGFRHPETGQEILVDSELPQDMQAVLDKWDNYVRYENSVDR